MLTLNYLFLGHRKKRKIQPAKFFTAILFAKNIFCGLVNLPVCQGMMLAWNRDLHSFLACFHACWKGDPCPQLCYRSYIKLLKMNEHFFIGNNPVVAQSENQMHMLDRTYQRSSGMAIRKLDISSLGAQGPHLNGRIMKVNLLIHPSQSPSRASVWWVWYIVNWRSHTPALSL